jgi:hypothetical protein
VLPDPLVGLELRRVRVFEPEAGAQVGGLVSTGSREVERWSRYLPSIGFAAVSPPNEHAPVRLSARVSAPASRGWTGRRKPPDLAVRATDASGRELDVELRAGDPGRWSLDLAAGTGPVQVAFPGLAEAFGAEATLDLRASTLPG